MLINGSRDIVSTVLFPVSNQNNESRKPILSDVMGKNNDLIHMLGRTMF